MAPSLGSPCQKEIYEDVQLERNLLMAQVTARPDGNITWTRTRAIGDRIGGCTTAPEPGEIMDSPISTFRALAAATLLVLLALPVAAESTDVDLTAADGVKLKATYTSPGKPGPGVLLLHMCNSDRSAWTGLAGKLAARGIHSLALDYRGFGDSGGEQGEGTARQQVRTELWPGDVDVAFEYLRSRPGVDRARIGAGGGSCGVDQAVQLARRHAGEVTTVVLLAGGVAGEATSFLAENPWLPILASASRDDGQAVGTMRWTIGFSSHPDNRFIEYPHGGHGTEMFAVHADLEPAIVDWYQQHLVTSPVRRPEQVVAKPGPSHQLWQKMMEPGGVKRFAEMLRASPGAAAAVPPQGAINAEGYRMIAAGETKKAIELMAFNVEAFPKSANALDSLGDAYLAAGQPEKAAEFARRTLAAIPNDPEINEDFALILKEAAEGKLETGANSGGD